MALNYPPDWPQCPSCGAPALDGHLTCGRPACREGVQRDQWIAEAQGMPLTEDDVDAALAALEARRHRTPPREKGGDHA
jgi:hypothetical protein